MVEAGTGIMTYSLDELAKATGLALLGDGSVRVDTPAPPERAGIADLAIAMSESYADALRQSAARAAIVWEGASLEAYGLDGALVAGRPRVALAHVTERFQHPSEIAPGIHPTAVIDQSAVIGDGAAVGPFAVIGPRAELGAHSVLGAHVSIGADAVIGDNALLHAGVRIGARCCIGSGFIAQPGAIIGADGFSFEPPQRGSVEAVRKTGSVSSRNEHRFLRIHSLAGVEIGDDVEVGAATTIDRGTLEATRIGAGTKIDNQVQIGHNVQVGETCLLCAQVGIAGSTTLGDRVVLGGKVGVADHTKIGSDVVCAAGSLIGSNIKDGSVMMGIPATHRDQAVRQFMAIKRLPRLVEQVGEMRKKLGL